MNLQDMKNKALELKNKAIDYSTKKIASSNFTISTLEDLEKHIEKSENKKYKNPETWEEKKFIKKVITIFIDEQSEFFKQTILILPVLLTKSFSQNIQIKLVKSNIKNLDLKLYSIKEIPSLVIFENKKVQKVITWEEKILKLVKSFDLDINKLIENIN